MPILSYPTFTTLRAAADVARFNVQVQAAQPARHVSWGQVFPKGKVPATAFLKAKIGKHMSHPVQMDVKTKYDDGTVRYAVVTGLVPALAANTSTHAKMFTTTTPNKAPVDLVAKLAKYNVMVQLTGGVSTNEISIKDMLLDAIADGTATYWLKGAFATQARVDIFLVDSFHIVADVTAYANGTFLTDLQFRNDYSMQATGGTVNYTAKISQNGSVVFTSAALTHYQYEVWRRVFHSTDEKPTTDTHNIQHNVADMVAAGALLNYDTTSGIESASIGSAASTNIDPLSPQAVAKYMPNTGARDDIGIMPAWCARWVKSQDMSAARFALAQANAAGSVPWHHYDPTTSDYLSLDKYPTLWIDDGNRGQVDLTQPVRDTSWTLDTAHTPALSFVPYLFTGDRYYLDEINAQATYVLMATWADPRQFGKGIAFNDTDQVRAQAWTFRAISEAAWANPDVTKAKTYWTKLQGNNLDNLLGIIIPKYNASVGEVAGYIFGDYRSDNSQLALGCFQQEFVISALGAAAMRGETKATQVLAWMQNWAIGRFTHQPANGWAAAVAYIYYVSNSSGAMYDTWAKLGAANGTSNALPNNDEYWVPLAMTSLAILYNLNGNPDALKTFNAIKALGLPSTATQIYQTMYPQYHVVPAKKA